jgi:hypothetical protein
MMLRLLDLVKLPRAFAHRSPDNCRADRSSASVSRARSLAGLA